MATRPSFRPRPIDSSKPLPIVRSSKDLRHEDDVVVSRALPTVGTGVEAAELEERHLQQALLASVFGEDASNKVDIPIPVFERTTPPRVTNATPFVRPPDHYIMFDRSDTDLEDSLVEYDADHVDEDFLRKYNSAHKKAAAVLSLDALERMMDLLEKLQGRALADEEDGSESPAPSERVEKRPISALQELPSSDGNPLLSFSRVRQELVTLIPEYNDNTRREVYSHWVRRRVTRRGAFHRLYIKPPRPDDPNPAVAFRPRGREDGGSVGRRMNTYDNYKRAVLLRDEFEILRKVMHAVREREHVKARYQAVSALHTRMQTIASTGNRLSAISKSIVSTEHEGYVVGSGDNRIVVSTRGLASSLPQEVEDVIKKTPFAPDRVKTKKTKRKSASGPVRADGKSVVHGSSTTAGPGSGDGVQDGDRETKDGRAGSAANQQQSVDSYGHDDHGKRFLKLMRYFAGGFMNYGVCPYDHRVFTAASERNTVTEPPDEPKPFLFPSAAVRFGSRLLGAPSGGKSRPERVGGKSLGKRNRNDEDLQITKPSELDAGFGARVSKKKARQIRVRGRVGRGGRIIMDRVIIEKDRRVKLASYPASVEMGGVYTAGLPLERADKVMAEGIYSGSLGRIRDLAMPDTMSAEDKRLVQPLQPMVTYAEGRTDSDGRVVYWPSRKKSSEGDATGTSDIRGAHSLDPPTVAENTFRTPSGDFFDSDGDVDMQTSTGSNTKSAWFVDGLEGEEELRRMPHYARRSERLVEMLN